MTNNNSPTVLVIGATGFLGKNILTELAERGIPAFATSRTPQGADNFRVCNILDVDSVKESLEGIDMVIHTAGLVSHDPKDADRVWDIHVKGTQNVVDACLEKGIQRVVYLSTSGTIGVSDNADHIADEESPSPFHQITGWSYYRSKYFAEQIAMDASKKGLNLICLNPSLLLGPGDNGESTKSIQLFLDDKIPVAPCGGIAFVDVRDVAKTVVDALQQGKNGARYLLNGSNMSFLEYYQRVARLADKPAPSFKMPNLTRKALGWFPKMQKVGLHLDKHDVEIASHFWYVDCSKANQELGFTSRDPMDTLYDTVQSLQKDEFTWWEG